MAELREYQEPKHMLTRFSVATNAYYSRPISGVSSFRSWHNFDRHIKRSGLQRVFCQGQGIVRNLMNPQLDLNGER